MVAANTPMGRLGSIDDVTATVRFVAVNAVSTSVVRVAWSTAMPLAEGLATLDVPCIVTLASTNGLSVTSVILPTNALSFPGSDVRPYAIAVATSES